MDINYFKSALYHHSKGNWNKAQEIYQHILNEDPHNYAVLQNYGPLLAQLRESPVSGRVTAQFELDLIENDNKFILHN